jgi:hypothetical protein
MKRPVVALVLTAALVLAAVLAPAPAGAQPACGFQHGFKAIADQIPDLVGQCLTSEYGGASGNVEQQTTGGLLVWRRPDNFTAFTDGYRALVNGPYGLQPRLNDERFCWEANEPGWVPCDRPVPTATPRPTPRVVLPPPVVYAPAPTQGVIESRIDGEFEGFDGDTIFRLQNGQVWQQIDQYHYHYAYSPRVLIYPSRGQWRLQVEGVSSTIAVERLR